MMFPPLIFGTLELIALTLLAVALGRRLLRGLRLPVPDVAERGLLATALGLGALQIFPFAIFALGLGRPIVFRASAIVLSLALLPDMIAVLRVAGQAIRQARLSHWWERWLLAVMALFLGALYTRSLCPAVGGDALGYHLTAVLRFLHFQRFVYVLTLTPTNWPLGEHMLFAWLLGIHPESPPAIVQFLFGSLIVATAYRTARRFGGAFAGFLVVVLLVLYDGFSRQGLWDQMTEVYIDLSLTLFTTLAIWTLHRALTTTENAPQWERIAAVFAGLAATTKLTGLWTILSGVFVLGLILWRRGDRAFARRALAYGGLAALIVAPWFVRTWVLTGNPFYPMLYSVFGGIEWSRAGWERFQRGHMIYNTPAGYPPTPAVLKTVHALDTLVGLILLFLTMRATRRSPFAVPAAFAAAFAAAICAGNYLHTRFLMPAVPTVLVCLAVALRNRERTLALPACLLATWLTFSINQQRLYPPLSDAIHFALGQVSRADYRRARMPDYPVTEYANTHLPPDARLLIGTYEYNLALYRGEAMWPDYWLQDSFHYESQARLEADFRRLNVRYLVLKTRFPDNCERSHSCRKRLEMEPGALTQLAQRCGKKLFEANDHTLYEFDWTH